MQHPFFINLRFLLAYIAFWILVILIHFSLLFIYCKLGLLFSLSDSIAFNILFALLGLLIWYAVRFSQNSKSNVFKLILNYFILGLVLILSWIISGTVIMRFVIDNDAYSGFLFTSIPWRLTIGLFFYITTILMYYVIIYYNNMQEKLKNEAKLHEMIKQAELDLIKFQLNPHFLFNSLNSISSLTITSPEKAQEMVIKLSDFLRYSISQLPDQLTTLKLELENSRRYLDIEQVRFGNKLIYENDISAECLYKKIPVLILQPLYENAVKHGVYESTNPITIKTIGQVRDDVLQISIINNFDPGALYHKSTGLGLKNILQRLKLIYGNDQLIQTKVRDHVFEVKLFIPQTNK